MKKHRCSQDNNPIVQIALLVALAAMILNLVLTIFGPVR